MESPAPFPGPRLLPRWRWCRSLGQPADIGLPYLQSGIGPGCSQQPYPGSGSGVPASHGNPPPGAVCCLAPFCTSYGLIASPRPSPMGMNLDVAGIDHQPLKVWVVDNRVQQLVPDASIPPATKAPMGVLPITVIWPRNLAAGPASEPQCAESKTPHSETTGYPWPDDTFFLLLQASEPGK